MSLTIRTHVEGICGWAKRSKRFVGWVKRSKLFVLSLLALTIIAGVHAVLAMSECGLNGPDCRYVLGQHRPESYRFALLHVPWAASVVIICMIVGLREKRQAWRMRYAICWMILFAITFGYVGSYHWEGLQGNQSSGQTLGSLGLAAVGVSTVLFVIWRGRIAGQANRIASDQSIAQQYQHASTMLSSDNVAVRLAGVAFIRELGGANRELGRANKAYRRMSVKLLRAFASSSKYGQGEDTDIAQMAITYLSDRRIRRRIER